MEIKEMQMSDIEQRKAEIREQVPEATEQQIAEFNTELDQLEERAKEISEAMETRAKVVERLKEGAGKTVIEMEKEEIMSENIITRNSPEYIEAFAKYIRTGKDAECRSLLSDAATGGTVPVPEFVYGIIAERVKASKILSRVRRMNAAGIVKVGFEISAPAAAAHTEGGAAITEEALVLGIVTMKPSTMKKWVSFSDEVVDNARGFLTYIYDEITRGIIKARENAVVAAILAAPQTATASAPAVAKTGSAAGAITDIVDARALLSSAAEDLVVICSPAQYAAYKGLQMAANYGVDPFDGLEVILSDAATAPIVGDLSGVLENLPKGDDIEFKYDDLSLMTSDMIRLLGRQPAAIAVVGNLFFAKVAA